MTSPLSINMTLRSIIDCFKQNCKTLILKSNCNCYPIKVLIEQYKSDNYLLPLNAFTYQPECQPCINPSKKGWDNCCDLEKYNVLYIYIMLAFCFEEQNNVFYNLVLSCI